MEMDYRLKMGSEVHPPVAKLESPPRWLGTRFFRGEGVLEETASGGVEKAWLAPELNVMAA